jgi:hypothetical protein
LSTGDLIYAGEGYQRGLYSAAEAAKILGKEVLPQLEGAHERATEAREKAVKASHSELPILNEIIQLESIYQTGQWKGIWVTGKHREQSLKMRDAYIAQGETAAYARRRIVQLETGVARATGVVQAHGKAVKQTRLELAKLVPGGAIVPVKPTGGGGTSRRKQANELQQIEQDLQEKLTLETLKGEEKRAFIMERSNEKIAEKFDAVIKRYGTARKHKAKREALEKQKQDAIEANDALANQKSLNEEQAEEDKKEEKRRLARTKLRADNEEIFRGEQFQAEADARLAHNQILFNIETLGVHTTAEERKALTSGPRKRSQQAQSQM